MLIWLLLKDFDAEDTEISAEFGSYVLGWVWTGVAFLLGLLMSRLNECSSELVYIVNQMFGYNEKIQENLTSHWKNINFQYNNPHERMSQTVEFLSIACAILISPMPVVLIIGMCNSIEPTHVLIREWFEIELALVPQHYFFLFLVLWPTFLAVEIVFELLVASLIYVVFLICYTSSMFPVNAYLVILPSSLQIIQYRIETKHFGTLPDSQLAEIYRVLQIINILFNNITASVLISLHHVVCLLAFVGFSFLLLEFPHFLAESGTLLSVFAIICWIGPVGIIFVESVNVGVIWDTTSAFVKQCKQSTLRRSVLRKYAASWKGLVFETAYPFYKVHRNTFLEFFMQGIDFLITLVTTYAAL
ncbi:unnamed protein product [Orchesella dallaii]|uniref:Odorant receptor n=1 Tax=Orchesella dallaii TaxID=48710 RepID=A0ABP1S7V1_9HEXA